MRSEAWGSRVLVVGVEREGEVNEVDETEKPNQTAKEPKLRADRPLEADAGVWGARSQPRSPITSHKQGNSYGGETWGTGGCLQEGPWAHEFGNKPLAGRSDPEIETKSEEGRRHSAVEPLQLVAGGALSHPGVSTVPPS